MKIRNILLLLTVCVIVISYLLLQEFLFNDVVMM